MTQSQPMQAGRRPTAGTVWHVTTILAVALLLAPGRAQAPL